MKRLLLLLLLLPLAALAVGCGGGARRATPGHLGSGPREVWFYPAGDKARSLVIFLHGYGGAREETPANHRPWLEHLAAEGNDVIYPRYEQGGSLDPLPALQAGVDAATARLGRPHVPVVVIGYSRGGRIAVDYAASQAARGHEPAAVLAVFPGLNAPGERLAPLAALDAKAKIVMMVGDRDTGVDGIGAHALLVRLARAGFPASRIRVIIVKSTKTFSATHLSVLESGRGARKAFWRPADRLIESVR